MLLGAQTGCGDMPRSRTRPEVGYSYQKPGLRRLQTLTGSEFRMSWLARTQP